MELFRLLGTIAVDNSGANVAIDETTGKAEKSHGNISKAFSKIGGAAVAVGKTVAVGLGAASAAIGAVTKTAFDGYAEFEQLKGGVETLFGTGGKSIEEYAESVGKSVDDVKQEYESLMKAQKKVLDDADAAYETAGLSANEYMNTVTSFSAALIQGLDGDTEKAAQIANRAITDMSDNANKMGTDMSLIQNAYQGFAKQNYTMLDNLKLGYGGTASEMARLVNESGVLGDALTVDAESINQVSFDKIIEAIGVVQDRMGITGTTANEAFTTIEGSMKSMKSAWSNLLTGLGNEDADLSGLVDKFVTSAEIVMDNALPRVEKILGGITKALQKMLPKISAKLPSMLKSFLPSLIKGAVSLFNGLISALPTLIQILIEQVPYILTELGTALMDSLPILFGVIKDMVGKLWDYVSLELLKTGVSFEDALSGISGAFDTLWKACEDVWNAIGKPIWNAISTVVGWVADMFEENMPAIQEFFADAIEDIKHTWEKHLLPALTAIGDFLENVLMPIFEYVFEAVIEPLVEGAFSYLAEQWDNAKAIFNGICDFLTGVFTGNFEKAFEGITNVVTGIFDGIKLAMETPIRIASDIIKGIVEDIKGFFDFEFNWPKIKMPHFSIEPKGWEFGDLFMGQVPTLGIEWYAKGGVFDRPTIFPTASGLKGVGEAGAEAVAPIDVLQSYVSEAVASQNAGLVAALDRILDAIVAMDENMGGNLRDALDGTSLKVGEREFARMVNRTVSRTQANEIRVGGAYV